MLSLALLEQIYSHDNKDRRKQHNGVAQFAEEKIDDSCSNEQQDHGLSKNVPDCREQIA